MSIRVSTVSNNQVFSTWLERVRQLCDIISSNTVTMDATTDGSISTGNAQFRGIFSSNVIVAVDGIRGGNVSTNSVLNFLSNTAWKTPASANILVVTSNSTVSSVTVSPNNYTLTPTSNVTLGGAVLNITALLANVTATSLNSNTILTQTGNSSFKANSSVTVFSYTGNSSATALTLFSTNTSINGTALRVNANTTVNGNITLNGNTNSVTGNLNVNGTLTVNNVVFVQELTLPNTAINGDFDVVGTSIFDGNTVFGTVLLIDTLNGQIAVGNTAPDPSSIITANGTITANSFRFPDGSLVPAANGVMSISQGNSSVTVDGSNRIVLTSNNTTIATMDSYANNINFFNYSVRAGAITANVSVTAPVANLTSIVANTVNVGVISTIGGLKVAVSNTDIQTIDSVAVASVRAVDWTIQIEDSSTLSYQLSKIMSIHDGSGTQVTEYAILTTNNIVGTITTDISGGNMRLRLTPSVAPLTVRIAKTEVLTV